MSIYEVDGYEFFDEEEVHLLYLSVVTIQMLKYLHMHGMDLSEEYQNSSLTPEIGYNEDSWKIYDLFLDGLHYLLQRKHSNNIQYHIHDFHSRDTDSYLFKGKETSQFLKNHADSTTKYFIIEGFYDFSKRAANAEERITHFFSIHQVDDNLIVVYDEDHSPIYPYLLTILNESYI